MNKKLKITGLRSLRKASHLGANSLHKSASLLRRVEHKSSKLIINESGSEDGREATEFDASFYHAYPILLPIHPALPYIGQKPSVTVMVPSLAGQGFYGGIATLLIVAGALSKELDFDLRLVQTSGYSPAAGTLDRLAKNGIHIEPNRFTDVNLHGRGRDHYGYLPLHPDDVLIVSAWWDAYTVAQLPLKRKFVYLVQDHESIFYDNGDDRQFAEYTYHNKNFVPLLNTSVLKEFFQEKGYDFAKGATHFEPAVGPGTGTAQARSGNQTRLFFYARPSVHRNMFYSGLKALNDVIAELNLNGSHLEVFLAGEDSVPNMKLNGGIMAKNLGKMSMDEYYAFARSIDVAMSLMLAPHPNYPTLELASLGATVVTTAYETKRDLSRYAGNILLAEPSVAGIAAQLKTALSMTKEQRIEQAKHNKLPNTWDESLSKPLAEIRKKLGF